MLLPGVHLVPGLRKDREGAGVMKIDEEFIRGLRTRVLQDEDFLKEAEVIIKRYIEEFGLENRR